jgi:hypothetical protein
VFAGVQREISALKTGAERKGITGSAYGADFIAVNIDISGLEMNE